MPNRSVFTVLCLVMAYDRANTFLFSFLKIMLEIHFHLLFFITSHAIDYYEYYNNRHTTLLQLHCCHLCVSKFWQKLYKHLWTTDPFSLCNWNVVWPAVWCWGVHTTQLLAHKAYMLHNVLPQVFAWFHNLAKINTRAVYHVTFFTIVNGEMRTNVQEIQPGRKTPV